MTKILVPRSDSVSAKVIEPSDFEELHSYVPDHIKSGFTVTAGSGLAVNVAAGKARLKGLLIDNTATESVTGLSSASTNYIYITISRDGNSEAQSWSFTSSTSSTTPTDSFKVASCVAGSSSITSVDQTFLDTKREPAYVPTGAILMWHGALADIPTGWVLCDGNNGTPNLIAKFVRGINTSSTNPSATGGSDTHTLTTAEMPAHTHAWTGSLGEVRQGQVNYSSGSTYPNVSSNSNHWIGSPSVSGTNASTGGGQAHENRPAFYEVAYIMKT
jgi:hypothetical protein